MWTKILLVKLIVVFLIATVAADSFHPPIKARQQTYCFKFIKEGSVCTVTHDGLDQLHRLAESRGIYVSRKPLTHEEHDHVHLHMSHATGGEIIALYGSEAADKEVQKNFMFDQGCESIIPLQGFKSKAEDEVIPIIISGEPTNRIDVVFMGDGYQSSERTRMVEDMTRLTNDMFSSTTFFSHLPLFNIWAVFRESAESGIGVGGSPKDTAFGLYRDGTELRGVYCSKPMAARDACRSTGPSACDFPSLIGNDEFYGGLGGEFTISTRSLTSGTIVLRHELGHNLIDVGEEYDGGSVYSGANSSPTTNVKWAHWLTDPAPVKAEGAMILAQDYAWYDLAKGPYTVRFTSNGNYSRWLLKFSVSGCEASGSLKVTLDGVDLPWNTTGNLDRSFYEYYREGGFSSGSHSLVFSQVFPPATGQIRQLCSLTVHEYKAEPEFHFSRDHIGAYPTWRQSGGLAGYRPNNERCLMRNMTSVDFCSPCIEEMWLQLLSRMSLIDDIQVTTSSDSVTVVLTPVPLAQFRPGEGRPNERYSVEWTQNGILRPEYNNLFEWTAPLSSSTGIWSVRLQFTTPEIRVDKNGATIDTESFSI